MNEGSRSGNLPVRVERTRGPSGCLIVKRKGDDASNGGSSSKERKRKRLVLSESESEEELLVSSGSKGIGYERDASVVRYCNPDYFDNEIDRKRKPTGVLYRDDRRIDRNKFVEGGIERVRSRDDQKLGKLLSEDGVEERRTEIGRNGVLISKTRVPIGKQREFISDSSRSIQLNRCDYSEFDRTSSFSVEREKEYVHMDRQRLEMKKHPDIHPNLPRENSEFHHDKPIRVQGKNGVLKVMPSNKNKLGGPEKFFGSRKDEGSRKISRSADGKTPLSPPFYPKNELHERSQSVVQTDKKQVNSPKNLSIKHNKVHGQRTQASGTALQQQSQDVATCSSKSDVNNGKQKSLTSEPCVSNRQIERVKHGSDTEKQLLREQTGNKKQEVSKKKQKVLITEACMSDSCTEVKFGSGTEEKLLQGQNDNKKPEVRNKKQKTLTSEPCVSNRCAEEVKRGSGTEKQLIREQIRQMLVDAGWKIDLRPRRNRDYQDSVYVNPSGTEYWSITKAYYAFQKQFENEGRDHQKCSEDFSSFTPIPEDVLCKLTRKTRKKAERELKMEKKADKGTKDAKENTEKKLKNKHVKVKTDSSFREEKFNSHITPDHKSLKMSVKGHNVVGVNADGHPKGKKSTMSKASYENGENKKRSSLLARRSSKGMDMDNDFVPYTGKRTILSWLIDMETVRLSGKVQYMNKKRTRTMLEGWITRDGIHCRCCSKILTISKFELHAGSKLHNPFQNIVVEDGLSLYQCQLDAWNKQDKSVRLGFHFIDVDDDPNDDTCGICGDGGELICCDGCPSTFHQTCLDIQMLPSGDWLCPNCSCKFCCGVDGKIGQEDNTTLCSCNLCEEKYHHCCRQHADTTWISSDGLRASFCGRTCEELFQQLQKLLGVKHELEAGFSWSLIQRSNLESDTSSRGQCQKAEFNSKIAVAFTVMDECFLPVIDHRSGVNLIHNVLFNIGSNINRLNYCGFYTAVLERGDEVIAAASIRIHGTRLAEMPFIGTRHIYRRQGMCRRLLNAIESVLCSLNIKKLVIPAISELMHTWTTVFGFKPLEESHRQELKTLNMLVFPSTDLLQKPLFKHKINEVNVTESSVVKDNKSDENTDSGSVVPETCVPANVAISDCKMNTGVSIIETGLRSPGGSTLINNPSDASTIPDSSSDCSAPDIVSHCGVNSRKNLEVETNLICDSSVEPKFQISMEDDPCEVSLQSADAECEHSGKAFLHHTTRNNDELNFAVASTKTNPHCHAGSKHDPFYMLSKPLDAAFQSISEGTSEESGLDTKFLINVVDHDTEPDGETKPATGSLVDSKLQNSIQNESYEVKTEAVNVELDHYPLNRTYVHHKSNTNEYLSIVTDGNHVQSKPDMKEHNIPKVECETDKLSYKLCIFSSENVVVNDTKVNNEDPSTKVSSGCLNSSTQDASDVNEGVLTEVSSDGLNGSNHYASDVTGGSSVVALRLVPDTLSEESTLGPKFLLPCMNNCTTLEVEADSSVRLKQQTYTENDVPELEVETCNTEHTNKNSNYPNAILGHSIQSTGGNHVEEIQDLNEHSVHEVGCTSVEVCDIASDVISARGNFQGCYENFVCHDPKDTCQPFGRNSVKNNCDFGGSLAKQHDFQPLQNVHSGSYGVTGALCCKPGSGLAFDDQNSQELVEDLVDCTSVVNGVTMNRV